MPLRSFFPLLLSTLSSLLLTPFLLLLLLFSSSSSSPFLFASVALVHTIRMVDTGPDEGKERSYSSPRLCGSEDVKRKESEREANFWTGVDGTTLESLPLPPLHKHTGSSSSLSSFRTCRANGAFPRSLSRWARETGLPRRSLEADLSSSSSYLGLFLSSLFCPSRINCARLARLCSGKEEDRSLFSAKGRKSGRSGARLLFRRPAVTLSSDVK